MQVACAHANVGVILTVHVGIILMTGMMLLSKDELDSEIPPGEETRYRYIMGMIDTCSL